MDTVGPSSSTTPSAHGLMSRPTYTTTVHKPQLSPKNSVKYVSKRKWASSRPAVLGGKSAKDATVPKLASRTARLASAAGRRLVPLTERRFQDEKETSRGKQDTEADKWDIAPDGGSAGREGRQFTVANVGNNGRIYLRPTLRPAHQRFPQPNFTFPVTPPGTGGLETLGRERLKEHKPRGLFASPWTPSSTTSPIPSYHPNYPEVTSSNRTRHRRAMSDSTVHEFIAAKEPADGVFKVVISKPWEAPRAKTMEDLDSMTGPLLNINIPSWRIGTPRFTLRGTPVIRGSSYAPTEEYRSSDISMMRHPHREAGLSAKGAGPKRPNDIVVPHIQFQHSAQGGSPGLPASTLPLPVRSTYMSTHTVIEPGMFDDLTFRPLCDAGGIVRFSPSTGQVTAATPPRLVAEITSPTFLDYELISDFFLTFRAFLDPKDLLRMLVARLRWAIARDNEIGMIVRVRTFVAMRHWILNYFMDDFVLDYDLRASFCNLVNEFVDELSKSRDAQIRGAQLKILAELKKCWRRVCAHYWDGHEFDDAAGVEIPVAPGGIAGNRDPNLDPGYWDRQGIEPPQLDTFSFMAKHSIEATSLYADVQAPAHIGDFVVIGNRPATPENQLIREPGHDDEGAHSPHSLASIDIVSCSFPSKAMKGLHPNPSHLLALQPASPVLTSSHAGPVATTPKTLVGKRVRPARSHKRNNSITDSLREHGSDKSSTTEKEDILTTLPSAGSLVRGNFLPPGQAFVDDNPNSFRRGNNRQTTIFHSKQHNIFKDKWPAGAMSGYGMTKLIGSVRRALRSRGLGATPSQASFMNISPVGPRGATTNRLPGTAVVPQEPPKQNGGRPPVRIDLLGAEVAEDFKKAIREEEAAVEAERQGLAMNPPNSAPPIPSHAEYSAAHMDSTTFDNLSHDNKRRPVSDMAITVGSQSIVIMDDTTPYQDASAQLGLSHESESVETFTDTFMPNGADPTPPNTPPGQSMSGGTPRRSSYLLNQHVIRPLSTDALPPFVPDLDTLGGGDSSYPSGDQARPSFSSTRHSTRNLPISGPGFRMHTRKRSSRTQQSLSSILHRRHASFSNGVNSHSVVQSVDESLDLDSMIDAQSDAPVPAPLRVLRRRPGGDLRAATNVGDLDHMALRRSRSVGSLTTYTDSIRSSYLLGTYEPAADDDFEHGEASQGRAEIFSLGQLATKPAKRNLSLFSTHSSKPVMRPSFEVEAQKLAQIPDQDDGGIESALSKLEGRFNPQPSNESLELAPSALIEQEDAVSRDEKKRKRGNYLLSQDGVFSSMNPDNDNGPPTSALPVAIPRPITAAKSFLSESSQDSYSSIPLLERGLTDEGRSRRATREWTNRSVLFGPDDGDETPKGDDRKSRVTEGSRSERTSFNFIQKMENDQDIKPEEREPSQAENQSFLDDDSTDGSDLSSEMSDEEHRAEDVSGDDEFFSKPAVPAHPFGQPMTSLKSDPPSPPMTLTQALGMSPKSPRQAKPADPQTWGGKPLPPTPETTPKAPFYSPGSPREITGSAAEAKQSPAKSAIGNLRKYSVHLPFILAFDSDVLAQQFTLIEKDALNEIDWKELIDMNWKNAKSNDSRSWVDFLRNTEAHGVEVVIARFNIMVKWAVSEIVLTQHIEERARCIIKLIHIAAHCRRYRNFATLAQLTIALSSNEVARLSKTWDMVPMRDIKTLSDLELLVTPMRNFYNIRAEMEIGTDAGCIPFVGIYTHDLLYNAQRPSEIASSPTTAPLVNFERCRVGAAVVKTLLRLLEASTRYTFQPIEGITERCLWMGALSDDQIRRHSESLE